MLSILTISNYLFGFITIPYQTRVLGPEYFGKIGFAIALVTFFQLFLDFGFMLSSTADVANNRDDKSKLSRIMTSVVLSKVVLIGISIVALVIIIKVAPKLHEDAILYVLFFISVAINSLLPDYLYRGLENMKIITYRTILVRLFFTIMVFVLLKEKSDYYYIPILNIIGASCAVVIAYAHVFRSLQIHFSKVSITNIYETLKHSSYYFYSRLATTVYDAANTLILGFIYPTGYVVGYFTSANKLISTARGAFTPLADSLYPYMINNKDYRMIRKILIIGLPIVTLCCTIVGVYAESICSFVFGDEFSDAAFILRLLLPLVVMALPNYLLGFPVLTPLGLAKHANLSTIIGAIVQICGLAVLLTFGLLNIYSICILTNITELSILLFRISAIRQFNLKK
jgi:PST family polysaccharide transporter